MNRARPSSVRLCNECRGLALRPRRGEFADRLNSLNAENNSKVLRRKKNLRMRPCAVTGAACPRIYPPSPSCVGESAETLVASQGGRRETASSTDRAVPDY